MGRGARRPLWLLCLAVSAAMVSGQAGPRGTQRVPANKIPTVVKDKSAGIKVLGGVSAGTLNEGYIGLNLEFFPETFPALASAKIRFLMSQLHPSYLRIGGNSADSTAYNFTGSDPNACSHQQDCFGPEELQALSDFAKAINWKVIFNVNEYYPYPDPVIDPNQGPRTPRPGPFVTSNIEPMLQHMAKSDQSPPFLTLGNELTDNLDAETTAHDYAALAALINSVWAAYPDTKPILMGPDCFWQNRTWLNTFLAEPTLPQLGALTWHLYLLNRTAEIERILDPEVLDRSVVYAQDYNQALVNASKPWPLWLTETGCAWGGELSGVADSFIGGFWWLDQLGLLATQGVVTQHRHTVFAYTPQWASSFLGTKEEGYAPRPDYWTSLLWGRLIGKTVLHASRTEMAPDDRALRVYAHCSRSPGGVVLVVINLSRDTNYHLTISEDTAFQGSLDDKHAYLFTSPSFDSKTVLLNGQPLQLQQIDDENFAFAALTPQPLQGDVVTIAPLTYGFIVLPNAEPFVCHTVV